MKASPHIPGTQISDLEIPASYFPGVDLTGLVLHVHGAPACVAQGEPPPRRWHPAEAWDVVVLPTGQLYCWRIGIPVQGRPVLDLTRWTVRSWLAAQIASRVGVPLGTSGVWWSPSTLGEREWSIIGDGWNSHAWVATPELLAQVAPAAQLATDLLPALARLDPEDDTRLQDGSRRVDAVALGLVALHVFGHTENNIHAP